MSADQAFQTFCEAIKEQLATYCTAKGVTIPAVTVEKGDLPDPPYLSIEKGPGTSAGFIAAPLVSLRLVVQKTASAPLETTAGIYRGLISTIVLKMDGGYYQKLDYTTDPPSVVGTFYAQAIEDWTQDLSGDPEVSQNVFSAILKTGAIVKI